MDLDITEILSYFGNYDTTSYYYEPVQIGQSYLGFVDENEKEITRLSIEKNKSASVEAKFMNTFNIRNRTISSTENNCTWRIINKDLLSLSSENGKVNEIRANQILGEAVVIAEEIDEDGNKTGVYAKLYVDIVEKSTLVAPKIESVGNHTIALKADGTVWAWGEGVNYRNIGTKTELTQIRIAKQIEAPIPVEKKDTDGTLVVDENGKQIYVYEENEEKKDCYQVGNNYTDLFGRTVIRYDSRDGKLYFWDAEENNYALEDLLDNNGKKIVVVDIATSNNHTLLLTDSGDVYSFGYNYYGQLGYNQANYTYYTYLPRKVTGLKDIVKIAVGDNFSLALDKYGKLWTFGYRYYSYNYIIDSTLPTQLSNVRNVDLTQNLKNAIDITNEYILTKDGKAITIGTYGKPLNVGIEVPGITGNVIKITRTSKSGDGHTAFLTEEGEVFTIGAGEYGQLGNDGVANSKDNAVQVQHGETSSSLTNIRDVAVGETHTMAIDKEGKLYTWGDNEYGQLRSDTVVAKVSTPRAFKVKADERIGNAILVSGGDGFTVIADTTGYAFAWGKGEYGQLGNELAITSYDAVRVGTEGASLNTNHITLKENGKSANITSVTKLLNVIYEQSVELSSAISKNTNIASTSLSSEKDKVTISPVNAGTTSVIVKTKSTKGTEFENIIQVRVLPSSAEIADDVTLPADKIIEPMTVSGKSHTLILKSDGTVWAYGKNNYGQTGLKDASYSDKVTKVEFPEGTASIIRIAAGDNFSVALDAQGNVWTWGYGVDSKVQLEPTMVLSNIVKIEAGANEVIALDKNGYVYTWGKNNGGSLGIGSSASVTTPTKISNIVGAIDIAVGEYHAMVLTTDGTVWTTGRNTVGQLGRGVQKSEIFEKVEIDAKIAYIEAGASSSVAIDVDGNLWAWGDNSKGQLGLTDEKVNTPTKVRTRVESASVGENHIHIVTKDGELYVAGSNNHGQLGFETDSDRVSTFTKVNAFGNNVMSSDAGTNYSTVITKDGKVYGFGDYDTARINYTDGFTPVMITNTTLYLDEQEVVVNVEGTCPIKANGKNKLNVLHKDNSDLVYTSENEEIAIIEDGVIKGVSVGTTTINISDKNEPGKAATMIVKVVPEGATQAPAVVGGDKFTVVTDTINELYTFGIKENIAKTDIPALINNNSSFSKIAAGKDFVVGINGNGTVWGLSSTDAMAIVNQEDIINAVQIAAGDNHIIALDKLGIVYVWGDNSEGQLGIINEEKVEKPTVLRKFANRIISVSANGNYSAVVDTEGKVYIIGKAYKDILNEYGQKIGEEEVNAIQEVKNITNAVKVAVGKERTIILTNNGSVYEVTNRSKYEHAMAESKILNKMIVDISANNDTFMCLASDKKLYTYGSNQSGKLAGNLSLTISRAEDVFTMGAGFNNTYYINTKGEVMSAGLNTSGELGNGTSENENATTHISSDKYVKVGNQEIEFIPEVVIAAPNWKVLVGDESLKTIAEQEEKTKVSVINNIDEFNVFGNKVITVNNYDYSINNTAIANITKSDVLEITANSLGKAILTATNKITGETKDLTIRVVSEDLLRFENMYINDGEIDYISELDENEDSKFIVNIAGSNPIGTLNIELAYNDAITIKDENENELTAEFDEDTNIWKVSGLDLTKSVQELAITLTSDDETVYEFTLVIFNELIVKVNGETLPAKDIVNEETLETEKVFTKYVNPENSTAKVEVSINDAENKIQLEDEDGNVYGTTNSGELLTIEALNIPNTQNRFIVKILNAEDEVEKEYVLRIRKSSIESVKVKDMEENLITERIDGGEEYLEEFTATILDKNENANITIELGNKNITNVTVDGEEITLNGSMLEISKKLSETEEITNIIVDVTVKDSITEEEYIENYIIRIKSKSSNNNIKNIELKAYTNEDNNTVEASIISKEVSDNELEIVLHNPNANLDAGITILPTLENKKATISYDGGITYVDQTQEMNLLNLQSISNDGNKYKISSPIVIKAENGDTKEYTLYIYKESENTEIEEIKITGTPSDKENIAIRKEGTDNYIGKVVNTDTEYTLVINPVDEYSTITSITKEVVVNGTIADEALAEVSGYKGSCTVTISKDKVVPGQEIKITVQAEHGEIKTYTLVLEYLDNNAEIKSIRLDNTIFKEEQINADEDLTAQVKSTEEGHLTVEAESKDATVKVYEENPETNTTATPIIEGKEKVELDIPFGEEATKTLYIEVTSEAGLNTVRKTLVATKLSNNTNINKITIDETPETEEGVKEATKTDDNTYTVDVSEATKEAKIVITAEDSKATVQVGTESAQSELTLNSIDISNKTEVPVIIISEDGTSSKEYKLKLNKLSADTSFTKTIQSSDGKVIKTDIDFELIDETTYRVEVQDDLGNVKLVVVPNDSNAEVVIKDASGNVIDGTISSNTTQNITIEVTSADGATVTYTIEVKSKHNILESASVTSMPNNATTELNNEDIAISYKEIRVHPTSTNANIFVQINSVEYGNLTAVNANVQYFDRDGAVLHDNIKDEDITAEVNGTVTNGNQSTFNVDLKSDKASKARVVTTITVANNEQQTLVLDIVKGSIEAELDYVEFTGITSESSQKQYYTENDAEFIKINSKDNNFNMNAVVKDNGAVKIYKLSEDISNWNTVGLSDLTEVQNNSEVTLTEEDQDFIIVVTAEFEGADGNKAEKRYKLTARKMHTDAELENFTITVSKDGKEAVTKHKGDFGGFVYNEETNLYEITALVPESINNLKVSNLVTDSEATVEWTEISEISSEVYEEYNTENVKELSNISLITERHINIKVTAENGDEKIYHITIKPIYSYMKLEEFQVFADNEEVSVKDNKAEILQAVEDVKVIGNVDNGLVALKVLSVNGHTINEEIAKDFTKDSNELNDLVKDYQYTDELGTTQTITKDAIRTIVIERQAKSLGQYLYPTYYDDNIKTDKLTITRLMTDVFITMKYVKGEVEETITSTDFDEAGELTVYLPSSQTKLVINEIKADNEYVKVKHGQKEDNVIYNAEKPYIRDIKEDRAISKETIRVLTEDNNVTVYIVKFVKLSNSIGSITVNDYKATQVGTTDDYTHTILETANRINIGVTELQENATAEIYLSAINDETITDTDKSVTYSEPENGIKNANKDIYSQLNKPLNEISKITAIVRVKESEDAEPREYTLTIKVEKSNLVSIKGINTEGVVDSEAELLPDDFTNGKNPYYTDIIKVPADNSLIKLTNIEVLEGATLTDEYGNVLTNKELDVNMINDDVIETKIIVTLNENRQEFIVRIQKKSTDTSIKEVKAYENTTNEPNTDGNYELDVMSTENPEVEVILNDSLAKVISAKVGAITIADIKDNKFEVENIAITSHQDESEEMPVTVTVTVESENGDTQDYDIILLRKHTETGLDSIKYEYDRNEEIIEKTLDYTSNAEQDIQTISANVEGIRITEIIPACTKATAYVQVDGEAKEELDTTKLYTIEEGKEKTFIITVQAEYGNEKTYTFTVRRLAANTNIEKIIVNGVEATYNADEEIYNANIRVDEISANILVTPEDANTKLKEVVEAKLLDSNANIPIELEGELDIIDNIVVENNKISIFKLVEYVDDTVEDGSENANRYVIVKFAVQAEDLDVIKEYTLKITRQHIDNSISDINYTYNENESGTITLSTDETKEIVVDSTVETLNINKITPACSNATVEIKVAGQVITQEESGFSIDLSEEVVGDGCIKQIEVTVTAECGYIATYKFEVLRTATNANLTKVIANDKEATRLEETEEGIEAIYRVGLGKTTKEVKLEAISANKNAIVEFLENTNLSNTTSEEGKATGIYDLSSVPTNIDEVTLSIKVTPQDTNIEAKIYKLIIRKQADRYILDQFKIKQVIDESEADNAITISNNSEFTADYYFTEASKEYVAYDVLTGYSYINGCYYSGKITAWPLCSDGHLIPNYKHVYDNKYWYQTEKIELPGDWTQVKFADILPAEPGMSVIIQRISGINPHDSKIYEEYTVDEEFTMIEGQDVYFKVTTIAENGDTERRTFGRTIAEVPYVIHLYKKATKADVSLVIDGTDVEPDEDGIYRVITNVEKKDMVISAIGTNNLDVKATNIDTESNVKIEKTTTGALSTRLDFSLSELDKIKDKVITLKLLVQPECGQEYAKEYEIEITRQDTSVGIAEVFGTNGEETILAVEDKQLPHYNSIGKDQVDNSIYTLYIDTVETLPTTIVAESTSAKIYLNEDYENIAGIGQVENINVEITENGITELPVRIVSEDGSAYKDYVIWYIKKSDNDAIKDLFVYTDGKGIEEETYRVIDIDEEGNYHIEISDEISKIKLKVVPEYEFANVSIYGQSFKWKEAEEIIDKAILKDENITVKLQVNIPSEQTTDGQPKCNTKYLYIHRVSTNNEIAKVTTDNKEDKISSSPQWNEKTKDYDTYIVNLADGRDIVDLTINPVSLGATLTRDYDGVVETNKGLMLIANIAMNDDGDVVTVKVNVKPEQGEAKDYYIKIVPRNSQAELEKLYVNGYTINLEEGKYEYKIYQYNLPLQEVVGSIEAIAKDEQSKVNIYTREHSEGIGEKLGSAIVNDVDFDEAIIISVTVMSSNGKNQNTYKLYFKPISDDSSLQEITYTDIDKNPVLAKPMETAPEGYDGGYELVVDYDQLSTDISVIASSELANIKAIKPGETPEEISGTNNTLTFTQDTTNMAEDIVLDVVVTAESSNISTYKLVIKKPTAITGKIITEGNNSGVAVKFVDVDGAEEDVTAITNENGRYTAKVIAGKTYNMVIEKEGYLTYEMINIPTSYGVRTYTGHTYLVAGDVYGNDGYIDLRDLTKVNKLARNNTIVDDTNKIYDLNEDGVINKDELDIMFKNYGKVASSTEYMRMIGIKGNVLNALDGDNPLGNTKITLREKNTTDESGNFEYENVPLGVYDLIVTNNDGTVLGQSTVTITEGTEYSIAFAEGNIITVAPNTMLANITVRVNGTGAYIAEFGMVGDIDLTPPVITEISATQEGSEIKLTATANDTENGKLASVQFYYIDETGEKTPIGEPIEVNGNEATATMTYTINNPEFNKTYKFGAIAKDVTENQSGMAETNITDNIIRIEQDLVTFSNIVNGVGEFKGKDYDYTGTTVILAEDLDLSKLENVTFKPIGNQNKLFKGTFDGTGHTIRGFDISVGSNYAGLFGCTNGATIKNVGIEGKISTSKNFAAGIVGKAINTTIEDCYNSATISGNDNVGGIVGQAENKVVINNCYNTGNITGTTNIGGIIGRLNATSEDTIIKNCYSAGIITSTEDSVTEYIGGIVGYRATETNDNGDILVGTVTDCYYTGDGKGIGNADNEGNEDTTTNIKVVNLNEFAQKLGEAYKKDIIINPDYPVLQWQKPPAVKTRSRIRRKGSEEEGYEELVLPVNEEYTISSEFGNRIHPVTGEVDKMHYGIDIAISAGSDVLSIAEGTVTFAGQNGGYGYCIEIEHEINGKKVYSFYAHLSQIDVEVGETVGEGQIIALSGGVPGTPGAGTSTGAHLHFEVRQNSGDYSSAVNPRDYLEF